MATYEMTNNFSEKILNWDKKDFTALVDSMTAEEINEMANLLENMEGFEIDLSYCLDEPDYSNEVVYNYIKRWLYCQIEEGGFSITRELFEIVMAMG